MKVLFAPQARADLNELLAYVKAQDARNALAMSEAIDQAINR